MEQKSDPYALEGVKNRAPKRFPWLTVFLGLVTLVLVAVVFSPVPEKVRRKVGLTKEKPVPKPPPIPEPEKIMVKEEVIVEKRVNVRPPYYQVQPNTVISKSSMGIDVKTVVKEEKGKIASSERERDGSYEAEYTLKVHRPVAAKSLDELKLMNPKLDEILPGLPTLLTKSKVSPFYKKLYDNKIKRLKLHAGRFDKLLTKHNYFDCQTMLEMEHPETQQKVFLMQGDMDVVSDGSDGDRLATMPDKIVNSAYYQPSTSFFWSKRGTTENPLIAGWRKRLAEAKVANDTKEVERLTAGIEDMKRRSFLIADYDPFIVIPIDVIQDRESAWGPNVGDYVLVIYKEKIYPAIVGDAGPSFKVGEGSLRMAKEINPRASSYSRPVSEVNVTYVVFPRSSGKWGPPNYDDWRTECEKLVKKIGGLGEGYTLETWEDTLPKKEEQRIEVIIPE
ncbi:glycoside hydrolase family 75 protein [Akkermansiaceae bacterium]|nr:glycoside hydrolase family 75 protein [Akkermansiaceae bacterium]MDA7888726.1 glycoside hydrolase family 75 protein [Akkermansiaceae bacterium]MDB4544772.1 glycoside hydrolase family 75 protein [Akkermansiaceae bacterium]